MSIFSSSPRALPQETVNILRDLDFAQKKALLREKEREFYSNPACESYQRKTPTKNMAGIESLFLQLQIPSLEADAIDAANLSAKDVFKKNQELYKEIAKEILNCANQAQLRTLLGPDLHLAFALIPYFPVILTSPAIHDLLTNDDYRYWIQLNSKTRLSQGIMALLRNPIFDKAELEFYQSVEAVHQTVFNTPRSWEKGGVVPFSGSLLDADFLNLPRAPAFPSAENAANASANGFAEVKTEVAGASKEEKDFKESKEAKTGSTNTSASHQEYVGHTDTAAPKSATSNTTNTTINLPYAGHTTASVPAAAQVEADEDIRQKIGNIAALLPGKDTAIQRSVLDATLIKTLPIVLNWSVCGRSDNAGSNSDAQVLEDKQDIARYIFNQDNLLSQLYAVRDQQPSKNAAIPAAGLSHILLASQLVDTHICNFEVAEADSNNLAAILAGINKNTLLVIDGVVVFINVDLNEFVFISDPNSADQQQLGNIVTQISNTIKNKGVAARLNALPLVTRDCDKHLKKEVELTLSKVTTEFTCIHGGFFKQSLVEYLVESQRKKIAQSESVGDFLVRTAQTNRGVSGPYVLNAVTKFGRFLTQDTLSVPSDPLDTRNEKDRVRSQIRNILVYGVKNGKFLGAAGVNAFIEFVKHHFDLCLELLTEEFPGITDDVDTLLSGKHILEILAYQIRTTPANAQTSLAKLFEKAVGRRHRWFSANPSFLDKIVSDKDLAKHLLALIKEYPGMATYILKDAKLAYKFIEQMDDAGLETLSDISIMVGNERSSLLDQFQYKAATTSYFFGFGYAYSKAAREKLRVFLKNHSNKQNAGADASIRVVVRNSNADSASSTGRKPGLRTIVVQPKPESAENKAESKTVVESENKATSRHVGFADNEIKVAITPKKRVKGRRRTMMPEALLKQMADKTNSNDVEEKKAAPRDFLGYNQDSLQVSTYFDNQAQIDTLVQYGHGAYGEVNGAKVIVNGTAVPVAVKRAADTPAARSALHTEISLLRQFSGHPNIVQPYGVLTTTANGITANHLVMQFMPGQSLYTLLRSVQHIPWKVRYSIAADIAAGLMEVHGKGVAHRDLKSRNILLNSQNVQIDPATGRVQITAALCDFGSARCFNDEANSAAANSASQGTMSYTAPERLLGVSSNPPASDMYSYSMILWELDTHTEPFAGKDDKQIREYVTNGGREDISQECVIRRPELAGIIRAGFFGRPEARPTADAALTIMRGLRDSATVEDISAADDSQSADSVSVNVMTSQPAAEAAAAASVAVQSTSSAAAAIAAEVNNDSEVFAGHTN